MLRTSRNYSTQRYTQKHPPPRPPAYSSLPRQSSQQLSPARRPSPRQSMQRREIDLQAKELKDFIDNYFAEEDANLRTKMPLIKRRSSQKMEDSDRKGRAQKGEGDLSASFTLERSQLRAEDILPSPSMLRWSVSAMEQLPSIHEQREGHEQQQEQHEVLSLTSKLSFLKRTSSMLSDDANPESEGETKICTFQNQLFYIYVLKREERVVGRVKEFKEKGLPFMERETRMRNYGIPTLWKESKYSHCSFIISPRPPLKDLLLKLVPDEANIAQMKVKQKALHRKLLANHCQQLALLLRNLCIELKGVEGKVLNNKINPSNLFLRSDGLHLAEWGYASFRDEFTIRENRFEKRRYGVLKGERDWFVSPEYLAPEIIRQMLGDDECDVWESRGSPDVWSLGVTFFELITLIPVWVSSKCSLLHRPTVSRCGILSAPGRQLHLLLKKQVGVQRTMRHLLATQVAEDEQNEKLFELLLRMVEPDCGRRISLDEIIRSL